jgi:cobalt/nickel transport system ATP-binding protein
MKSLVIKNLNYLYPDGTDALREVALDVERGSRLALLGGNGSGKTTLLLHIAGLLDGDGYIAVMGIERSKKTIEEIRRRVGLLFSQVEYQFIMPDLLNDIMLSLSPFPLSAEEKRDQALQWLRRFNLEQYQYKSPLDLSSGEMKRAALAAIVSRGPDILLLDEPLNNLDKRNSMIIIDLLRSFESTMIIATHRRIIVEELSTHIAVMDNGRITGLYENNREALSAVETLLF